ncbi:hypothetical protein, partial [Shewanella sp.]|uniref:hypothetical protein n=1 Tax=Shewanella sp. TaxID=50422 RepID=UPI003F314335
MKTELSQKEVSPSSANKIPANKSSVTQSAVDSKPRTSATFNHANVESPTSKNVSAHYSAHLPRVHLSLLPKSRTVATFS